MARRIVDDSAAAAADQAAAGEAIWEFRKLCMLGLGAGREEPWRPGIKAVADALSAGLRDYSLSPVGALDQMWAHIDAVGLHAEAERHLEHFQSVRENGRTARS